MFNTISWQGYWVTIALLTAGYYLVIYLLYYRDVFKIGVNFNDKISVAPSSTITTSVQGSSKLSSLSEEEEISEFSAPSVDSEELLIYSCIDELNAYLAQAKRNRLIKRELILALYNILQKYPSLANSQYKDSISSVIVSECEHLCSIHLSADDLLRVWFG